jgi:uncharacterized protein YkwD/uncharacterized membrane protein required for colicin V production
VNLVDLAILLALAFAAFDGWRAGFVRTIYSLATWLVGLTVAILVNAPLGTALAGALGLELKPARVFAFVGVLLLAEAAFAIVAGFALAPLVRGVGARPLLRRIDRAAGIVPSVARMLVIVALVLSVLVVFPVVPNAQQAIDGSRFGGAMVSGVAELQPQLERLFGGGEGALLVTKISADEQQRLEIPDGLQPTVDAEAEKQLFDLVNGERARRGLAALSLDPRLVPVARAHAAEMFRLRYFGHLSPVTGTPFDRLAKAGIVYQRAGENLAYAPSVTVAHQGLMDSEGHRENILRPEFTELGIGVMSAGIYGRMFVQLFLTP